MRHHSQTTTQLPAPSPVLVSICSAGTMFNTVMQRSVFHIDDIISLSVPEQMVQYIIRIITWLSTIKNRSWGHNRIVLTLKHLYQYFIIKILSALQLNKAFQCLLTGFVTAHMFVSPKWPKITHWWIHCVLFNNQSQQPSLTAVPLLASVKLFFFFFHAPSGGRKWEFAPNSKGTHFSNYTEQCFLIFWSTITFFFFNFHNLPILCMLFCLNKSHKLWPWEPCNHHLFGYCFQENR